MINSFFEKIGELIFISDPGLGRLLQCTLFLFCMSFMITWVAVSVLKPNLKRGTKVGKLINSQRKSFFMLLLNIQLFVPLLGSFLVLLTVFFLKTYKKIIYPFDIVRFKNTIYIRKEPVKIECYGEGWASVRLDEPLFSPLERRQALVSLSKSVKKRANPIYNQLLSDDEEELRIWAFSLLENQQNFIHEKINGLLKIYRQSKNEEKKAFYSKNLALLYWELIYLNLGEKEFRKIILEKSKLYAEKALNFYQQDPFLWILLARIFMEMGEVAKGLEFLRTAEKNHAPLSKIYPYFAEHSFLSRDFDRVQQYLGYDPAFKDILKLSKMITFWCENGS